MAGQAPFVVNVGLTYGDPESGIDAGLFYNVKGRTLEIISSGNNIWVPVTAIKEEMPKSLRTLRIHRNTTRSTEAIYAF